jgi:hypothetical protein
MTLRELAVRIGMPGQVDALQKLARGVNRYPSLPLAIALEKVNVLVREWLVQPHELSSG